MNVTMSISTGLDSKLDLLTANKLHYTTFGVQRYVTSSALTFAAPVGPPQSVQVESLGPDQLLATWKVLIYMTIFLSQNMHKIYIRFYTK
jgi:hypothetical protein